MKWIAAACLLLSAGCSSAPVADAMDYFWPGRLEPAPAYHGGVGVPQPAPAAPAAVAPSAEGSLPPPPVPPTDLGAR